MRFLNHGFADDRSVLQHILQVDQIAVVFLLRVIVGIVEVNDARFMRLHDLLRQQNSPGQVLAHLSGHIVSLGGVDHRVLVGVFLLRLFVIAFDQCQNLIISGIGLTHQRTGVAIGDVPLCHLVGPVGHNAPFHHILNFLHGRRTTQFITGDRNTLCNSADLHRCHSLLLLDLCISPFDCMYDLLDVKFHFRAISFDYVHSVLLSVFPL